MTVLEDLIAAAGELYPPELRDALALPPTGSTPDERAEAKAQVDVDTLKDAADLDPGEQLLDFTVRGDEVSGQVVTFIVQGADKRTTKGFFPLDAVTGSKSGRRARSQGARGRTPESIANRDQADQHGTATVASVGPTGGTTLEQGEGDGDGGDPGGGQELPAGVPKSAVDANGEDTAKLISDPPAGVDPAAVWQYEQDTRERPRVAVERAAAAKDLPGADASR